MKALQRLEALFAGGQSNFLVRTARGEVLHETKDGAGYALIWAQDRADLLETGDFLTIEEQPPFADPTPRFRLEKQPNQDVVLETLPQRE